jgi:hypothetical protein
VSTRRFDAVDRARDVRIRTTATTTPRRRRRDERRATATRALFLQSIVHRVASIVHRVAHDDAQNDDDESHAFSLFRRFFPRGGIPLALALARSRVPANVDMSACDQTMCRKRVLERVECGVSRRARARVTTRVIVDPVFAHHPWIGCVCPYTYRHIGILCDTIYTKCLTILLCVHTHIP